MTDRSGCVVWKLKTGEAIPLQHPIPKSFAEFSMVSASIVFFSMRSSTILLLTLRALSQEAIKNLVLAGVGRLIVMDDQVVSERDLGAGLLFREEDGDVGKMVSLTGNKHPSNIRSPVSRTASSRCASADQVFEPSRYRYTSFDAVPFRRPGIWRTAYGNHRGILETRKGGSRMRHGSRQGAACESRALVASQGVLMLCDVAIDSRAESTRLAGIPTRSSTVPARTATLVTSSMISETTLNGSRRKSRHR